MFCRGSFTLPHGYDKYNDDFLAHPPSRVHIKVYETIVKMPESIYFELAPKHEIYEELFSDSLPDKDDIGLYFFPDFSHRFTSQPWIFRWPDKLTYAWLSFSYLLIFYL